MMQFDVAMKEGERFLKKTVRMVSVQFWNELIHFNSLEPFMNIAISSVSDSLWSK